MTETHQENQSYRDGDTHASSAPIAIVIGAGGGIGSEIMRQLKNCPQYTQVVGLGRNTDPPLDLLDQASIERCAQHVAALGTPTLIFDATGVLHNDRIEPEKSLNQLDAAAMAESFAINAIGPALLMKHFLPLLPRKDRAVFASLSAKVGSISDNRLGGWYSYRASKAALNQLIRTAAIELKRTRPHAICVALHPGTVATLLSERFRKSGLEVQTPEQAAAKLVAVINQLTTQDSGGFFDYAGQTLTW
jgi:NAD(P)-dependent dehydrogenase (short-subunit alcohol dehydrogenase family)